MTAIESHRIIIVACILSGIVGCSGDAQNKLSNVGETVGEGVTEFAKGIGKGVDNRLEVSVELSPALIQSGISTTVAKQTQFQAPSARRTVRTPGRLGEQNPKLVLMSMTHNMSASRFHLKWINKASKNI